MSVFVSRPAFEEAPSCIFTLQTWATYRPRAFSYVSFPSVKMDDAWSPWSEWAYDEKNKTMYRVRQDRYGVLPRIPDSTTKFNSNPNPFHRKFRLSDQYLHAPRDWGCCSNNTNLGDHYSVLPILKLRKSSLEFTRSVIPLDMLCIGKYPKAIASSFPHYHL